jgi:BolA protein
VSLQALIEEEVKKGFSVCHLVLENESQMHSRGDPESHFKLILVSNDFEGVAKVRRHQSVYKVLSELMPQFHALALHLYTEKEWGALSELPTSSLCGGGH